MLWIWVGVIIASLLVEYLSKNFTSICFVFSAVLSLISTFFTDDYFIQVCIFLILGILLIAVVRPNVIEYLEKNKKKKKNKAKK